MFSGEGYIVINTKAETVDELRRDIVSNSDISHSDLQSLAMNTDGGRLSLKVPLFESSANVENEYDAKFDEVLNAFNTNPNDPRILCVTLTESAKNFASGSRPNIFVAQSRPMVQKLDTIDNCIEAIETQGLYKSFKETFGIAPEEASLSTLQGFLFNEHNAKVQELQRKPEKTFDEKLSTLMDENIKLAQSNNALSENVQELTQKVNQLTSIVNNLQYRNNNDDDEDDEESYPDRLNISGIRR
jgi:hypothetical protein